MRRTGRQYVLIGPGRWGSPDHWLGIPVGWGQISCAKVIVEAAHGQMVVDPSQGSHFFHNLATIGVAYLTLNEGQDQGFVAWGLAEQPGSRVRKRAAPPRDAASGADGGPH